MAYRPKIEDPPLYVSNGTDSLHTLNVSTDGRVDVNWDNCPINEETIRAISSEEAKKALEVKTHQLREELDNDSPIRILRRKVHDWLKS